MPGHHGRSRLLHTTPRATEQAAAGSTYIDVRHWVISPNHRGLLIRDLVELGRIPVRGSSFAPTVGQEFFPHPSSTGAGAGLAREELLEFVDSERRTLDRVVFGVDTLA